MNAQWLKALISVTFITSTSAAVAQAHPGVVPFGTPSFRGNACPEGSVGVGATESAVTFIFSDFNAATGPGTAASDHFKTCHIKIPVTIPHGWQVSVESVDYRGFASVEAGAWGVLKTWYMLAGKGFIDFGSSADTRWTGPVDTDYLRRDTNISGPRHLWSPCGGDFKLDMDAYLYTAGKRGAQSLITVDSTDGAIALQYGMAWRRCH